MVMFCKSLLDLIRSITKQQLLWKTTKVVLSFWLDSVWFLVEKIEVLWQKIWLVPGKVKNSLKILTNQSEVGLKTFQTLSLAWRTLRNFWFLSKFIFLYNLGPLLSPNWTKIVFIFLKEPTAQTSTGQAGPKFTTVFQREWKNNLRDFKKKIWLL